MKNTLRIEDGKVYGFSTDLGFTSSNANGESRAIQATWNFDGMSTEDFCSLAWANFKVVVQRTTLKKATNAQIAAYKGQTLMAKDYLEAGSSNKTAELAAANAKLAEVAKTFMQVALDMATVELGIDASKEALQNRTMAIFNERFASLVK